MLKPLFIFMAICLSTASQAATNNFTTSTAGLTKENEYQIGQAWLRQIRAAQKEWHNPLIEEYIYQHVRRLGFNQIDEQKQLTVVLIDDPQFNAFATIGGVVGVTRGFLENIETENQMLAVLAHELAHLKQRHIVRAIEEQRNLNLINLASIVGGILIAMAGQGEVGEAIFYGGQAQTVGTALAWSRDKETEADQVGAQILTAAGYPASAMYDAQELMARLYTGSENPLSGYLSTHPLSIDRLSTATNEGFSNRFARPDSPSFKLMKQLVNKKALTGSGFTAFEQYLQTSNSCNKISRTCLTNVQQLLLNFPEHLPSIMLAASIYHRSGLNDLAIQQLNRAPKHAERNPEYWAIRAAVEKNLKLLQQSALSSARANWHQGQEEKAIKQLTNLVEDFDGEVIRAASQQLSKWTSIMETYQ